MRRDPVTDRVVLLAPGRSARPFTVAPAPPDDRPGACPFCPGHEHETPPEAARRGPGLPDTPGWRVRVVPNLYPIVGGPGAGPGGGGAHEVVVFTPDHGRDLGRLDDAAVRECHEVLRARARVHAAAGAAHVQVLVNHGRAAGASIAHPHAQLLALEFVPPAVTAALERFAAAGRDVVMDDAEASVAQGGRVLTEDALAWCPFAAASPFETRITSPHATARFEDAPDDALDAVARATRDIVRALTRLLGGAAYNVVVHNGPAQGDVPFHWYVTVVPRISVVAGFEMGTGVLVNTLDPAEAAARLRDALRGADSR